MTFRARMRRLRINQNLKAMIQRFDVTKSSYKLPNLDLIFIVSKFLKFLIIKYSTETGNSIETKNPVKPIIVSIFCPKVCQL